MSGPGIVVSLLQTIGDAPYSDREQALAAHAAVMVLEAYEVLRQAAGEEAVTRAKERAARMLPVPDETHSSWTRRLLGCPVNPGGRGA